MISETFSTSNIQNKEGDANQEDEILQVVTWLSCQGFQPTNKLLDDNVKNVLLSNMLVSH